jgi:hypothetical protein
MTLTSTHCWQLVKSVGMLWKLVNTIHVGGESRWTILAVTVIEMVPYNWFYFSSCFLFVLGLGWFVFPLFPVYWYVVRSELYNLVIMLSLKYFQVDINCKDVESLGVMTFPLSSFSSW